MTSFRRSIDTPTASLALPLSYALVSAKIASGPGTGHLSMLKLKHLRHPLRTAALARARVGAHLNIRRSAKRIQGLYAADPRYVLDNVTHGFAHRPSEDSPDELLDDLALLQRICNAYLKAVEDQQFQPKTYRPTGWWQQVRTYSLGPVMRALQTCDLPGLRIIYRNFFRDPCSTGLVDRPYGMANACSGAAISDLHRRFYLGDALHRIDTWAEQMGSEFTTRDLAGPGIGNPFGIVLDGALIQTGAPYQHYCAQRIIRQLDNEHAVVAEIGGGYGGMAYYLLRDRAQLTYFDFDLPESLALTAYYLHKTFPSKTFLLYGESELNSKTMQRADVVLMPLFELPKLPPNSVRVSFSANAISDLSREALAEYLCILARCTRDSFLHIGSLQSAPTLSGEILRSQIPFHLTETRSSSWYTYRYGKAAEVECLYRVGQ
jgi:hypothetical protein